MAAGPAFLPNMLLERRGGLAAWQWGASTALSTPRPWQVKREVLCSWLQAELLPAASQPARALHRNSLIWSGVVCACLDRCSGFKLSLTSHRERTPPGHLKHKQEAS